MSTYLINQENQDSFLDSVARAYCHAKLELVYADRMWQVNNSTYEKYCGPLSVIGCMREQDRLDGLQIKARKLKKLKQEFHELMCAALQHDFQELHVSVDTMNSIWQYEAEYNERHCAKGK